MRTPTPRSTDRPEARLPAGLTIELDSFLLSLEAENLAAKTRRTYGEAVELLGRFLVERGMPTNPASVRREHVEAFVADQVARWRPNTARNRYLALKRFFDWLTEEGLIETSPMARMRPPRVPEEPVPLIAEETVRTLLRACGGKGFADRRDTALIRLLIDTGARRSEIVGLTVDSVDLRDKVATVLGKGRRPRIITFGSRTALALDRYLRERRLHRDAERPELHELDLAFFDDHFEGATPTEQLILEALGRQSGQVRLADLRRRLPDLAGHDVLVRRLVDRGLVYRATRGTYDFALPLFRDYLRRRSTNPTERTRTVRSVRDLGRSEATGS
jgi:site-specific recombinase XerD